MTLLNASSLRITVCSILCLVCGQALAYTRVVLDFDDVELSSAEKKRLEQVFYPFISDNLVVNQGDTVTASIRLTHNRKVSAGWSRSKYQLPNHPAFALYSLGTGEEYTDLIAVPNRPISLRSEPSMYPVDNADTALTLLENGRVSSVLDYIDNTALYRMQNEQVQYQLIRPAKPVFIDWLDTEQQTVFEQRVAFTALANQEVPFIEAETVNTEDETVRINWFILNKAFDRKTNKLTPLAEDVEVTRWWANQLSDYPFDIRGSDSSMAFSVLSESDNSCVLNVNKTEPRQAIAHFSEPAFFYLDTRIYALKASDNAMELKDAAAESDIDIGNWIGSKNDKIMGYSASALTRFNNIDQQVLARRDQFLNIDDIEPGKAIDLLTRRRVDYLVAYPSIIKESRKLAKYNKPLVSFPIANAKNTIPAFIACSDAVVGRKVIAEVNQVLSSPTLLGQLLAIYSEGFTPSETHMLKDLLHAH